MSVETGPKCRHCGDPLVLEDNGYWVHAITATYHLYRCQHTVPYGHNAAHPDVPCMPGGPNPCACTDAPKGSS